MVALLQDIFWGLVTVNGPIFRIHELGPTEFAMGVVEILSSLPEMPMRERDARQPACLIPESPVVFLDHFRFTNGPHVAARSFNHHILPMRLSVASFTSRSSNSLPI